MASLDVGAMWVKRWPEKLDTSPAFLFDGSAKWLPEVEPSRLSR
jgi:hypothetical protein